MSILISVVIPTYNRAEYVADTIESFCKQTLDRSRYEIIVVDNNSTDDTRAVVERLQHYGNVCYCLERKQGSSHARNRGLLDARGPYIAYVDDECLVESDYLAVAQEIIERHAPAIFGGPELPYYKTTRPPWFKDSYATLEIPGGAQVLTKGFLHGCNFIFNRDVLQQLGGFDPTLGITGATRGYGEDIAPQQLLRATIPDACIYYDPRLIAYHVVRPEKMDIAWVLQQRFIRGQYTYRLFLSDAASRAGWARLAKRTADALLALGADMTAGLLLRDRRMYPYAESYLFERSATLFDRLGRLVAQIRNEWHSSVSQHSRRSLGLRG